MISKTTIAVAVTIGIWLGATIRTEDAECLWLLSQKTDMFSDLELLPRARRVATSLLPIPSNSSNGAIYDYALYTVDSQNSEPFTPREKALEFLHANPFTPKILLKLRLKEIELCCHIICSHDPRLGSHLREVQIAYTDQL